MPSGVYLRDRHKLPPRSKSGLKGVLYFPRCASKPWKSYIRHHGQYVCLGYYATKEEAAMAYNRAALKLHGADAYLNPIPC